MSGNHRIEVSGDITVITFQTPPSFDDLRGAIDDLADNYPYRLRLWDLRDLDFYLSMKEIQALAEYGKDRFRQPNTAAIVAQEDLAYGESRVFEVLRQEEGHSTTRVFRNRAEAIRWLEKQR